MSAKDVVILSAARTPIGSFQGALAPLTAPKLGSIAAKAALERAQVSAEQIQEVYVGTVLPANQGQAPGRQAALGAGIPNVVPCTTINKVCGSGLKTVMLAAQAIRAGDAEVVLAGGMESMSNAPYYVEGARGGFRFGHQKLIDGMIKDGLWDVYHDFHMGSAAELCARECNISRSAQDELSMESYRRAREAIAKGWFKDEIVTVEIAGKKGEVTRVDTDEEPAKSDLAKMSALKGAFEKEGTVTAANSSKLNDGASMVVVASREWAEKNGKKWLATIKGYGSAAQAPEWFTTAPAKAIQGTLDRLSMKVSDIDLFEINEAFAVVALANEKLLGLDRGKVNVHGGAVALGHPIGASGTRILTTLLYALKRYEKKRGLASLCIGGGEAVALVVERSER
ncbi:MAG: acetyl-CoA C-acyltransferase [Deltaproteobacteria bacterium]|nr:acetyl-CoA C-acyltransferase [Deltaproteobacteria bacterium]